MDFFSFTLSGYRQSLAMAITIYAIKYVKEKKLIKFLLTVLVASLFHQSALVFLIVYPLAKIKITKSYLLTITSMGILALFFGDKIINLFISFYDRNQIIVTGQGYGMFAMLLILTAIGLFFYKYAKQKDPAITLFCHLMLMATFLQIFSFHLSIFVRVVSFFSVHMIIFIPNIISSISSKWLRFVGSILTVIFAFAFYMYFLSGNPSGTVPYFFLWGN
jgi:Gpi18-like mannosyltransferase